MNLLSFLVFVDVYVIVVRLFSGWAIIFASNYSKISFTNLVCQMSEWKLRPAGYTYILPVAHKMDFYFTGAFETDIQYPFFILYWGKSVKSLWVTTDNANMSVKRINPFETCSYSFYRARATQLFYLTCIIDLPSKIKLLWRYPFTNIRIKGKKPTSPFQKAIYILNVVIGKDTYARN